MKNVLITGFFHPYTRPGGSFRVLPLMKLLPEFGWNPVILTPALLEKKDVPFRVVGTEYRDIFRFWQRLFGFSEGETFKRQMQSQIGATSRSKFVEFIFNRAGEVITYPDPNRGWKKFAVDGGKKILQAEKIDLLFSCHPTISHIVTRELKKESGLPWVADLPDLWSRNHNYRYSSLRRLLDQRTEKKTLGDADVITTVSEPWAQTLRTIHKGKNVLSIQHGFPPEEFNDPPIPLTDKFTITYTGSIYPEGQDLTIFFQALRQLIDEEKIAPEKIDIRFYGAPVAQFEKAFKDFQLMNLARQYGPVPRAEAVQRQGESQVLLFAKWKTGNEAGWYSGKIYEYLAARRPILAVDGRPDVVTELLKETQAGIDACEYEEVKSSLLKMYREFQGRGAVSYHGRTDEIQKYSHREMTGQFVNLFDSILI